MSVPKTLISVFGTDEYGDNIMIKKLIAVLLCIVMVLGLFACGKDPGASSQESSEQSSKSQSG